MKKLFLFLITVLAMVACEGPMGPQGEPGRNANWDVYNFTVESEDWTRMGGVNEKNSYYTYVLEDQYLSNAIVNQGNVTIYLVQYTSDGQEVQTPLPFIIHYADDNNNFWTETISYDFKAGSIAFYVTYSDFATENAPSTSKFRIVLTN